MAEKSYFRVYGIKKGGDKFHLLKDAVGIATFERVTDASDLVKEEYEFWKIDKFDKNPNNYVEHLCGRKTLHHWTGQELPFVSPTEVKPMLRNSYIYMNIVQLCDLMGEVYVNSESPLVNLDIIVGLEKRNFGVKICRKVVEIYVDSTKEVLVYCKENDKIASIRKALSDFYVLSQRSPKIKEMLNEIIS